LEDFYQQKINNQNPSLDLDLPKVPNSRFDYKIITTKANFDFVFDFCQVNIKTNFKRNIIKLE
jgi:hypothetical protein